MSSELAYEASDEASENELLERSLSVWKGWTSIEWEDFAPTALDIHTACSIGHYEWVRSIILKGEDPALDQRNHGGWTPLMYACYIGHDNIVNLLINAGCNMNMKNSRGHTPLMLAATCGNEGVARTLVRRGAQLELTDKTGWTALFHATYAGHQNFVAFLLEAGANKDAIEASTGMTPFMEAAIEGHEIIVQLFLQHGVNINAKAHNGEMARSLALMNGHMKIISLIDNHVLPVSRSRSQSGVECYQTSKETQYRKHLPPVHSRRLKPQSPSIRDGPEAIARMIDRTRNKDTVAYPNLLVPKGYVTFPINGIDKEDTKMSYRDVTSPINPEDYKDSSGSRAMSDLEDFNDDSNAFTKTGAITIRSSSSSSGGLVAALGLSREGSLDSDDSHSFEPATTSSDDAAEFPEMTFENSRVEYVTSNDNDLCEDVNPCHRGGSLNTRVSDKENLMPSGNTVPLSSVNSVNNGYDFIENSSRVQENSQVASPLQDYFPSQSTFPLGTTVPPDKCQGLQHESSVPLSSQQSSLPSSKSCMALPKDNMSQVEIVNRFLKNLTVNNPETSIDQHRWADDEPSTDQTCGYRDLIEHSVENLRTTESISGRRRHSLPRGADSEVVEYPSRDNMLSEDSDLGNTSLSRVTNVPQTESPQGVPGPSFKDPSSVDVQGQQFPRSTPSHHQTDPSHHQKDPSHHQKDPSQYQKDPSHHQKDPSQYQKDPSHHQKDPSHHQKDPSQNQKDPSHHQKDPSQYQKDPSHHQKDPSQYQKDPSHHQKDPSHHQKDPSQNQKDPSHHQKDPSQNQKDPSHHQKDPSHHQKDPSQYQKDPSHHQKDPSQYQKDPSHHQKDPSHHQKDPSQNQKDPSHQQKDPSQNQKDPSHHQKDPSHHQKDQISHKPWSHHPQLNHHHPLHNRRMLNHSPLSHRHHADSSGGNIRHTPPTSSSQSSVTNQTESEPFLHLPKGCFYNDMKASGRCHQNLFTGTSNYAASSSQVGTAAPQLDFATKPSPSPYTLPQCDSSTADSTVPQLQGSVEPQGFLSAIQTPHLQAGQFNQHIPLPHNAGHEGSNPIEPLADHQDGLASVASGNRFQPPSHTAVAQSTPPATVLIPGHTTSQPVSSTIGWDQESLSLTFGPRDLGEMFSQLGLTKYLDKFEEQDVDLQVFLSMTDNDLRELGVKLFGPRKKMTNAIARWHSMAPIASSNLEQAYADKLEAEMQEMAIQLNQAYEKVECLKAQVLQEQQLRSVTESCLVEERAAWEQGRQILVCSMENLMSRLRQHHKQLKKHLEQVSRQLSVREPGDSPHSTHEAGNTVVKLNKENHQKASSSVYNVSATICELLNKSEQCLKEMHQTMANLVMSAEHLLKSAHGAGGGDEDRT